MGLFKKKKQQHTLRLGISENLGQVSKADKREVKSLDLIGGEKTNPANKH